VYIKREPRIAAFSQKCVEQNSNISFLLTMLYPMTLIQGAE
jgi:hypothetical protein